MRALLLCPLALSACLVRPPVARLTQPTPIAVALLCEQDTQVEASAAPAPLRDRVDAELGTRNLVPQHPVSAADFGDRRETSGRLAQLAAAGQGAALLLLVESKAVFFSQISGRYRWAVHARITVARAGAPADLVSTDVELPAVLDFDHEREAAAIALVGPRLAAEVGQALDRFLGGRAEFPRLQPPAARRADAIYFVLVDRFHNGDPSNDGTVDRDDPLAWHGGDLRGVREKLDYLEQLGVRTLWLSPLTRGRQAPFLGHGAYHGYWVDDHLALEPRFGSEAELRQLVDAARARGMRVLFDTVLNHVSYDAPLVTEKPAWFHRRGTIADWDDPVQLVEGQVHGLPDLDQENPEVYAYLLTAARHWIDRGRPDGFRLDAIKHASLDFWARFNRDVRAYAGADFELLGEVFEGDAAKLAQVKAAGGFSAVFDFPLHYALTESLCAGGHVGKLGSTLFADRAYDDPAALVTFLDNHDLPRIASVCADERRLVHAISFMLALRGTPCLLYGTEAALVGLDEPEVRRDMVFDPAAAPRPATARAVAEAVRAGLARRQQHPALVRGETRLLAVTADALAILRWLPDDAVLVVLNRAARPFVLPIPAALAAALPDAEVVGDEARLAMPGDAVTLAPIVSPDAAARAALAAWGKAGGGREIRFEVRGGPAVGEAQLFLVGLGPELGDWQPERGFGPLQPSGAVRSGTLALPTGGIFEYKLVARGATTVTWERRDNRYLLVPPGAEPLVVPLAWDEV